MHRHARSLDAQNMDKNQSQNMLNVEQQKKQRQKKVTITVVSKF